MSSNPSDELKDFEKARQSESMRASTDRDAQDLNEEFSDEEYWEDDLDFDDDPGAGLFKKLVPVGLGLIAVSVIGGGILIMLGDNKPTSNIPDAIPLIEAETTPEKTKPETPGGMVIPHQDKLVLNNDSGTKSTIQVEKLLPPPEVPQLPKAEEPKPVQETTSTAPSTVDNAPEKSDPASVASEKADTTAPKTTVEENKAELTPPPAPKTAQVESVLAPAKKAAESIEKPAAKETAKTEALKEVAKAEAAKVAPKPAEAKTAKPVSGQYVLQLASLKSKDGAMTEWKNIQRKLSDLLGSKQPIIEKASISGVGVRYRLQTGPFENKKAASDFCSKLKAAKRDCLVKKVK